MRFPISIAVICAVASVGATFNPTAAQNPADVRIATATPAPEQKPKFTFILFWKENNPATQEMATSLKTALDQRAGRAESFSVNVADPAQSAIVERYRVARAPMPMVLCLAPNGVITGAITKQLTDVSIV